MATNITQSEKILVRIKNIIDFYSHEKYSFIYNNSPDFIRHILNTAISNLLSVEVDDSFFIRKTTHRALYYYELRLLIYLRSFNFKIIEFSSIVEEIYDSSNSSQYFHKVDLQLLEALPIFKSYISDPIKIDKLIKIHQYVSGLWKNGSKYLHFYTLHSEEHSLELIKQCTKITKTIDYLKLKSDDYYILFLACYLHDISMVLHPNLEVFTAEDCKTDLIYSEWKRDIYKLLDINLSTLTENKYVTEIEHTQKVDVKIMILDYFKKLDEYFEENIRSKHAFQSASFIKEQNELNFIDKAFLQLVADVSEAHYYDAKDVYKLKSKAKNDLFDTKYLMIILRLADLFDMTRERISTSFMKQNINYMSRTSKYHWISHLSINNCHIESEFKPQVSIQEGDAKIEEIIRVIIHLNTCQLTRISDGANCLDWCANYNDTDKALVVKINEHQNNGIDNRCKLSCNLSCKWFVKKQEYLLKELYELQRYLNRNENNIFKTYFQIELHFDTTDALPQEYLDVVLDYI